MLPSASFILSGGYKLHEPHDLITSDEELDESYATTPNEDKSVGICVVSADKNDSDKNATDNHNNNNNNNNNSMLNTNHPCIAVVIEDECESTTDDDLMTTSSSSTTTTTTTTITTPRLTTTTTTTATNINTNTTMPTIITTTTITESGDVADETSSVVVSSSAKKSAIASMKPLLLPSAASSSQVDDDSNTNSSGSNSGRTMRQGGGAVIDRETRISVQVHLNEKDKCLLTNVPFNFTLSQLMYEVVDSRSLFHLMSPIDQYSLVLISSMDSKGDSGSRTPRTPRGSTLSPRDNERFRNRSCSGALTPRGSESLLSKLKRKSMSFYASASHHNHNHNTTSHSSDSSNNVGNSSSGDAQQQTVPHHPHSPRKSKGHLRFLSNSFLASFSHSNAHRNKSPRFTNDYSDHQDDEASSGGYTIHDDATEHNINAILSMSDQLFPTSEKAEALFDLIHGAHAEKKRRMKVVEGTESLTMDSTLMTAAQLVVDKCVGAANLDSLNNHNSILLHMKVVPEIDHSHFVKVFGVPCEFTCMNPLHRCFDERGVAIPRAVKDCLDFLGEHGAETEGLFRVSGSAKDMESTRNSWDRGEFTPFNHLSSVHDVAGLLKLYLRLLPDPLMEHALYERVRAVFIGNTEDDDTTKGMKIRKIIDALPNGHYACLERLIAFGNKLQKNEHLTKMNASNVAICITPSILAPAIESTDPSDMMRFVQEKSQISHAVAFMISNYSLVFTRNSPYDPELKGLESEGRGWKRRAGKFDSDCAGTLVVDVISTSLTSESATTFNPFVIIELGGQIMCTKTQSNNNNPLFMEQFELAVFNSNVEEMNIYVYSMDDEKKKKKKHTFLGMVVVPLSSANTKRLQHKVRYDLKHGLANGTIDLAFTPLNYGATQGKKQLRKIISCRTLSHQSDVESPVDTPSPVNQLAE